MVDEALPAEEDRVVALGAGPVRHLVLVDVVDDRPAREREKKVKCGENTKMQSREENGEQSAAHFSVCFVSGYFGFSGGRLTRGGRSPATGVGALKIDGAWIRFCCTSWWTVSPPNFMGVRVDTW